MTGEAGAEIRAGLIERRRAGAGTDQEGIEQAIRHAVEARAVMLSKRRRRIWSSGSSVGHPAWGRWRFSLMTAASRRSWSTGRTSSTLNGAERSNRPGSRVPKTREQLRNTIERILAPLGQAGRRAQPMADARLPDGSRVNVVIPPLAVDGPAVSIRRFPGRRPTVDDLVPVGTPAPGRRSGWVAGGGASQHPDQRRHRFRQDHAAECPVGIHRCRRTDRDDRRTRPSSASRNPWFGSNPVRQASRGRGEVTIRDLLETRWRMRPDRILIGEVRGAEALDLLTA